MHCLVQIEGSQCRHLIQILLVVEKHQCSEYLEDEEVVAFLRSLCWWSLRVFQQKMCMVEKAKDESDFCALVVDLRLPHCWLLNAFCVIIVTTQTMQ